MFLTKYLNNSIIIIKSIYKSLNLLISIISKIKFDLPTKNKYLILDQKSKTLIDLFNIEGKCSILKTNQEEFNLWIILISLSKIDSLKLSNIYKTYLKTYISYINPDLIMTYIHNNPYFWKICEEVKSNFYIFQNGYCSPTDPLPKKFETSKNSIFFTLTRERSCILKKNGVRSIPFGSLQSNSIPKSKQTNSKKIVFVSQYRYKSYLQKINYSRDNLSYEQWNSYDTNLLEIVNKFANIFDLNLYFMGVAPDNKIKDEKLFFNLKNKNIKYQKKFKSLRKKFEFLDKSHIVIGVDSTLLYQCLGRNIKTFFGTFRGYKEFNYSIRPFLESIPNNGFGEFWTNKYDEELILKILSEMHLNSSKKQLKSKLYEEVPFFNPMNFELTDKLNKKIY